MYQAGPKTVFIVICGGGKEYDFLFGTLDRHLPYGDVAVIDTSEQQEDFELPRGVSWYKRPIYGFSPKTFRFHEALNDAIDTVETELKPFVLVQVDCDEYYGSGLTFALEHATTKVVRVHTLHYTDPTSIINVKHEWHRRIWPAKKGIHFISGKSGLKGNPAFHPNMVISQHINRLNTERCHHYHLHYAFGHKEETEAFSPQGEIQTFPCTWPIPIQRWHRHGIKPSDAFRKKGAK